MLQPFWTARNMPGVSRDEIDDSYSVKMLESSLVFCDALSWI